MLKSEYVYYRGHKVSYDSLKKHSMIPIDIICDECLQEAYEERLAE